MLFFASTIHDASKEPLAILRDIPTKYWTLEVGLQFQFQLFSSLKVLKTYKYVGSAICKRN